MCQCCLRRLEAQRSMSRQQSEGETDRDATAGIRTPAPGDSETAVLTDEVLRLARHLRRDRLHLAPGHGDHHAVPGRRAPAVGARRPPGRRRRPARPNRVVTGKASRRSGPPTGDPAGGQGQVRLEVVSSRPSPSPIDPAPTPRTDRGRRLPAVASRHRAWHGRSTGGPISTMWQPGWAESANNSR